MWLRGWHCLVEIMGIMLGYLQALVKVALLDGP